MKLKYAIVRSIQTFALLPCTLFLSSHPISDARLAEVYEKLIFETSTHSLSADELSELRARGMQNAETLFELFENSASENEPVRQGLKQLRLIVGNNLATSSEAILRMLERRISSITTESKNQHKVNHELEYVALKPFAINAENFVRGSLNINDHNLVLTSADQIQTKIEIWNMKTNQKAGELPAGNRYFAETFLGDGRHIAVNYAEGNSNELKFGIYDMHSAKLLTDLGMAAFALNTSEKHYGGGFWISHDGQFVMGRNANTKNFAVWNSKTNQTVMLTDPSVRARPVERLDWRSARFRPDGTIVTIDPTHIHHWDPLTGHLLKTIPLQFGPGSSRPVWPDSVTETTGAVSPDAKYWATPLRKTPSDNTNPSPWVIFDLETGKVVLKANKSNAVEYMLFSPDSQSLLLQYRSSTELIDINSQQIRFKTERSLATKTEIAFSPNGKFLAAKFLMQIQWVVSIWDIQNNQELTTIGGLNEKVANPAFSSDSTKIITQGNDHKVRVWQLDLLLAGLK